jgi:glutaminyl-tRNA synthetase
LAGGRCDGRKAGDRIRTRFPPEPNGYLHIGHAKSICNNFGFAKKYGGRCHLRFDDTNPEAEKMEYILSIQEDVKWLGFDWGDHLYFASDYFDTLHQWAIHLIKKGQAYVDSQTREEMAATRGNIHEPGKNSPFRGRSVEENLRLFQEMTDGKHAEGTHVLRAKCDMASPNMNMRDPPIYRILHKDHPKTGSKWKVYPMYDFAHGQEDAIEGITHSICTLEFDMHRELYDWLVDRLPIHDAQLDPVKGYDRPYQFEFSRLNVTDTVMSKRKLLRLVKEGIVDGWDDPRMPTICGMRRRGVPAAALRNFCEKIGITKNFSVINAMSLEESIRDVLEPTCARRLAVLQPLKVTITNFTGEETVDAVNHPADESLGSRPVVFTNTIYVDREDFREDAGPEFYRLKPGGEVKLRWSYVIKCVEVVKKGDEVVELKCTYDPATLVDMPKDRKVKGVIQWVSEKHGLPCTIRLLNKLLKDTDDEPAAEEGEDKEESKKDFMASLNPENVITYPNAMVEPSVKGAKPLETFQFERVGFFAVDPKLSTGGKLVFNRTVTLKESGLKKEESKDAQKRSRKDEQAKQLADKEAKKKLNPKDMFRDGPYSKFDDDGVPTHDADGQELTKSGIKKLRKDWEKQKKIFEG